MSANKRGNLQLFALLRPFVSGSTSPDLAIAAADIRSIEKLTDLVGFPAIWT